jgi:hypothetical protein
MDPQGRPDRFGARRSQARAGQALPHPSPPHPLYLPRTMSLLLQAAPLCPSSAAFFGFMGVTAALVFANLGASYGTAKAGVGIASMGIMHPTEVSTLPATCVGSRQFWFDAAHLSWLPPVWGHSPLLWPCAANRAQLRLLCCLRTGHPLLNSPTLPPHATPHPLFLSPLHTNRL